MSNNPRNSIQRWWTKSLYCSYILIYYDKTFKFVDIVANLILKRRKYYIFLVHTRWLLGNTMIKSRQFIQFWYWVRRRWLIFNWRSANKYEKEQKRRNYGKFANLKSIFCFKKIKGSSTVYSMERTTHSKSKETK